MFELLVPAEKAQLEKVKGDKKAFSAGRGRRKGTRMVTTAASVPGFIGFAVGRTDFWKPVVGWREKRTTREAAVDEVARRYREFVDIFEKARAR